MFFNKSGICFSFKFMNYCLSFQFILFLQHIFRLFVQWVYVLFPTGAKIYMPPPKSANQWFGRSIIFCSNRTVFAIVLCHKFVSIYWYYSSRLLPKFLLMKVSLVLTVILQPIFHKGRYKLSSISWIFKKRLFVSFLPHCLSAHGKRNGRKTARLSTRFSCLTICPAFPCIAPK